MRILFVGFVWPEPTSSAAGQNILSYIETARENQWEVSFCSAAQKTEHCFDLSSIGVNTFEISLNCSSFDQQVSEISPMVVIFDRYLSFEQFAWRVKQSVPSALLVLDAEDLHCLRIARHKLLKRDEKKQSTKTFMRSKDIQKPENIDLLYSDTALREIACVMQADLTCVLSKFEKDLLINEFQVPANQVAHLAFILSCASKSKLELKRQYSQKQDFVFIGNYRHAPNYFALKILAEQCWPKIYQQLRQSYPDIACHVYGAYMPGKVKQLENKKQGLVVHGFASNQFRVINQAKVMLAPISFGAGVKGKLLDAMQCATPSITTMLGQEGITDMPWPGIVVNSIDEFIDAAVNLYQDEKKWQICVDNADSILLQQYQRKYNQSVFIHTLESKLASLEKDRQGNFLQKMLNHHQFQSSKYMSQWIEAKNK